MHPFRWAVPGRTLASAVIAILIWTTLATAVVAAADKSFGATVQPAPLVAGASYGSGARAASFVTLTLTNTSGQASLGSANVTAPDGIVLTGASSSVGSATVVGNVIQLRTLGLAPSTSVVVSISARVECAANHASYTWAFTVKQANDFNGVGNDLAQDAPVTSTISGACGITFSKQPAHSEKTPTAITSAIYAPTADPVTVSVRDAADVDVVPWWSGTIALTLGDDPTGGSAVLAGGLSGSASGGSVTFAPTIDRSATGYSLIATATPTAGSASAGTTAAGLESANFNIVDDAAVCTAGNSCSATAGVGQKTSAKVDAQASGGSAGDLVILSIADPTVTLDCAGYSESSDAVVYDVTTSNGTDPSNRPKVATMTLAAAFVTRAASKYDVCYSSNLPFTTKSGTTATTGLLPACANRNPQAPCVVSRTLDKQKNLVIVVSSPPGDPAARF
ncbi:MAG TPA: hypothetical protein VFI69_06395 [Candidatus Limnocylindrales bacterium]|nr:hypothetical protein [Candidatus Limnocylindrales bacterium]